MAERRHVRREVRVEDAEAERVQQRVHRQQVEVYVSVGRERFSRWGRADVHLTRRQNVTQTPEQVEERPCAARTVFTLVTRGRSFDVGVKKWQVEVHVPVERELAVGVFTKTTFSLW